MEFRVFSDLIMKNCATYPDKDHLFFKERSNTYKQTGEAVLKTAAVLKANGVKKGDRVAIIMENCPEFLFAYGAVVILGAIVVPTNTFLTDKEIAVNLNDCTAEYIITSDIFAPLQAVKELVPTVKKVFTYNKASFDAVEIYSSPEQAVDIDTSFIDRGDSAAIIYTSGTTGNPKGVELTHKNLVENAKQYSEALHMTHHDRTLLMLPMFHSFSFLACVSGPLVEGTSVIILSSVADMTKAGFFESLAKLKPTMMLGVPAVYAALTRLKVNDDMKKAFTFRVCASGGAPLPVEVIKRFKEIYDIPIVEGYGLSEAAPGAAVNPLHFQKPGSIGFPLPRIETRIVDADGSEVPVGVSGELCLRGENVMKGYWKKPKETAEVIKNGWLHTGDVAKKDEDGFIYIVDRIKDLIIVKGMNVYPREIDELLYQYKGVVAAAVVGVPYEGSEVPIAYIQAEDGVKLNEAEIKAYLKEHIAAFKMPRRILLVNDIPMNAAGKVLKKELRERAIMEFG